MKGAHSSPSFIYKMAESGTLGKIEGWITSILDSREGHFLVSLAIKQKDNIKVFIDSDTGVSIETCVKVNRELYKLIEEDCIFPPGAFSLEVSSPGIGEPLILHRQFVKNIGRNASVELLDGVSKEGKLVTVTHESISIETVEGKGKKATVSTLVFPFAIIKKTTILV